MFLTQDIAHDIVHRESGNISANCPACNGTCKMDDCQKLAGDIITKREKARAHDIMMEKTMNAGVNPMSYREKAIKDSHLIDVFTFSEDSTLPEKIQLIPLGKWNTLKYGEVTVTKDMLDQMVKNFSSNLRAGNTAPIDIEHGENATYGEAAAGWIQSLVVASDGLWGTVSWNDLGKKLLGDKQYKFLSPEFNLMYADPLDATKMTENVLIAASLVNRPLFRNLKPLVCDEGNLTKNTKGSILISEPMKLSEILIKPASSLAAEEKEFLKVHASELTEEQKKTYGFSEDKSTATATGDKPADATATAPADAAISGKEETTTIKASELAELMKMKETVLSLQAKEKRANIEKELDTLVFGEKGIKIKTESKNDLVDFVASLNDDQKKAFTEKIIPALPEAKIFGEKGTDNDSNVHGDNAMDELNKKANEIVAAEKVSYEEALKKASEQNPELVKQAYGSGETEAIK